MAASDFGALTPRANFKTVSGAATTGEATTAINRVVVSSRFARCTSMANARASSAEKNTALSSASVFNAAMMGCGNASARLTAYSGVMRAESPMFPNIADRFIGALVLQA